MRSARIVFWAMLLAACSERETHELCTGPAKEDRSNCRTFDSQEQMNRWLAADDIRKKAVAQRFADDYRVIVAVTLKEYLQTNESEFENVRDQYFVSIFGEDVDEVTRTMLRAYGIETELGSRYVESERTEEFRDNEGHWLMNTKVGVSDIESLSNGSYRVTFGYSCGMLCAGSFEYVLRKDTEWVFVSKRALWFS